MNFQPNDTLAGYARASVDLRARMIDYHRTPLSTHYLHAFFDDRYDRDTPDFDGTVPPRFFDAMRAITGNPWELGEPYVVAPAMTAIVAAAAAALDLTGEVLPEDIAQAVMHFASATGSGKSTGNMLNVDGGVPAAYAR